MRRAVFLDRDGTLVKEKHYLSRPEEVELYSGSVAALRLLRATGLAIVLVSNQSGIARGLFDEPALAAVHRRLQALLAEAELTLDGIYYCPHHPEGTRAAYRQRCDCRKPGPGLIERAARELALAIAGSWVVGDKQEDVELGMNLGLRTVLVRTGHGRRTEASLGARRPERVVADLRAAARWIKAREDEA